MTAVIDIQGFPFETFCVKEMTIIGAYRTSHIFFKPPMEFRNLTDSMKTQVHYLERYHGLRYSKGNTDYKFLKDILRDHLYELNLVYLKGHQKEVFLKNELSNIGGQYSQIDVINVETLEDFSPPIFIKDHPKCPYHKSDSKYMCSLTNCEKLYHWVFNTLSDGQSDIYPRDSSE